MLKAHFMFGISTSVMKYRLGSVCNTFGDFPGGAVEEESTANAVDCNAKNPPANAGDTGSSPGWGRSRMLGSN